MKLSSSKKPLTDSKKPKIWLKLKKARIWRKSLILLLKNTMIWLKLN